MRLKRKIFWLAISLPIFSMSIFVGCASAPATQSRETQFDMNEKAWSDLQKADAEMNSLFDKIVKRFSEGSEANPAFVEKFKLAQKAWITFRDAEIEAIYPPAAPGEYGSIQPFCEAIIRTQMTKSRIADLRDWWDGIEEGECCYGSRPMKK